MYARSPSNFFDALFGSNGGEGSGARLHSSFGVEGGFRPGSESPPGLAAVTDEDREWYAAAGGLDGVLGADGRRDVMLGTAQFWLLWNVLHPQEDNGPRMLRVETISGEPVRVPRAAVGVEQAAATLIKLFHLGESAYRGNFAAASDPDDPSLDQQGRDGADLVPFGTQDGSAQLLQWLLVWEAINGPARSVPQEFRQSFLTLLEPHVLSAAAGGRFVA